MGVSKVKNPTEFQSTLFYTSRRANILNNLVIVVAVTVLEPYMKSKQALRHSLIYIYVYRGRV